VSNTGEILLIIQEGGGGEGRGKKKGYTSTIVFHNPGEEFLAFHPAPEGGRGGRKSTPPFLQGKSPSLPPEEEKGGGGKAPSYFFPYRRWKKEGGGRRGKVPPKVVGTVAIFSRVLCVHILSPVSHRKEKGKRKGKNRRKGEKERDRARVHLKTPDRYVLHGPDG